MNRNLKILFLSALLLLYAAPSAKADHGSIWGADLPHVLRFAHFGNGVSIVSEIILVNSRSTEAEVMVRFSNHHGEVLSADSLLDIDDGMESTDEGYLTLAIAGNSVSILRTNGAGELVRGSVAVKSQADLKGYIRFTTSLGAASVEDGQPATRILIPVQRSASVQTALALQNVTDEDCGVSCRLFYNGVQVATEDFRLPANAQIARHLTELFPDYDTMDQAGLLDCSTTRRVVGLALDVGANGLSSLPVIAFPSSFPF